MSIRRSTRIQEKSYHDDEECEEGASPTAVVADEATYLSEDEEGEEDESIELGEDDEDYEESLVGSGKRKRANKPTSSKKLRVKESRLPTGAHRASKQAREKYIGLLQDFKPCFLFDVIANSGDVSIEEVANNWLDKYAENRDAAVQEFVNLLLGCCGALLKVEEHDVANNESCSDTMDEVRLQFQKQEIHEFYLLESKNHPKKARYEFLCENFMSLTSNLMTIANERGMLYDESTEGENAQKSVLIMDILTWLSAMSVSKIRCLRYVAILALYSAQDALTALIVDLENNYLVNLRRQLGMEEKKKRSNQKTMERLKRSITELQDSKTVMEALVDDLIKLSFMHRFKDVDELIRAESMIHLAKWLENYPEFFFKVSYLKYFGWLLSDSSSNVRSNVLKMLLQIVKFSNKRSRNTVGNTALRQFFERFKERLLDIAERDVEYQVRLLAVQLLSHFNAFGYLEDEEVLQISSLLFEEEKRNVSSSAKNVKFLNGVAKFFSNVEEERCERFKEQSSLVPNSQLDIEKVVEVGIFIQFLITSLTIHLTSLKEEASPDQQTEYLFQASEFLQPHFGHLMEPLCDLLTFDDTFQSLHLEQEKQSMLLLPDSEDNIAKYVVVLNGLCHGGVNASKSANKAQAVSSILPKLQGLFAKLPLYSEVILSQLLRLFELFDFEDWAEVNQEKSFSKIAATVVRCFSKAEISNAPEDTTWQIYSKVLDFCNKVNVPSVNELWKSEAANVKVLLQTYLEKNLDDLDVNSANEKIVVLYSLYINKLVLMSKVYPLECGHGFLELFFNKFINRLPEMLANLTTTTTEIVDFRLMTLIVVWALQAWFEVFDRENGPVTVSRTTLDMVKFIAEQISAVLIALRANDGESSLQRYQLENHMCETLADILTAFKMFEIKVSDKQPEWGLTIKSFYQLLIDSDVENAFNDVFLYLESLAAQQQEVSLDHFEREDVELNDIRDTSIPDPFRQLCIFVVKLKSLAKLGYMNETGHVMKRLHLNKQLFGDVYLELVDDTGFETREQRPLPPKGNGTPRHETSGELEPIEEYSGEDEDIALELPPFEPTNRAANESFSSEI
ncbi:LAMI_0C04918g1_1 [Lachancea mirantina]|uniref:LAMI_0C04918g1_1 n=1 Tax=Lachancea mirantina TaxID=1230905 RepID=A0A1G4J2L4_9SACH|nr:LAMI_0C04918g1_1 [Lachancea mirantina]